MSSVQSLIPEITDQDVDWVCRLLGFEALDELRREFLKTRSTVDVSACPGSGKTTLIIAKLAILAQKWPYRAKGICILSHTNAAREVIQHKLGRTVVGQQLLSYPHFIDTIHGFVNRFLALPWLYANGFPVVVIDDDVTTAYRRGVIGKGYFTVQNFLKQKSNSFENLRITGRDFSFDLNGKPFPARETAASFRLARQAVEASAKAGYFCYDEVFVWAKALLEDHPQAPSWLACRFPLVIIDEMQDTSDRQGAILNTVFPRQSMEIVVQRMGDSNQAIFNGADTDSDQSDPFPDSTEGRCINISNSFRFGQQIATLASPFAVQAVTPTGLCGVGPKGSDAAAIVPAHAIFLFPDDRTAGVLDAFGKHALTVLPADLLEKKSTDTPKKNLVNAVGAVHREASDIRPGHAHFPKTVSHYWAEYRVEISRKEANPQTFIQYVWLAQTLAHQGTELYPAIEKIALGFIRLADLIGDIGSLNRKTRAHRAITEALIEHPEKSARYRKIIRSLLIDHYYPTETQWPKAREAFTQVASALCQGQLDYTRADSFLAWPEGVPPVGPTNDEGLNAPGINVYRVTEGNRHVDIHLGSIHSVKGQDHLATLVLNTYWYDHAFARLLPWLLGEQINGDSIGPRDQTRLLQTYVAMTRPSHLLCLAMQRSLLGDGDTYDERITRLQQRGWRVAELVDGIPHWRT